jgi:hypothetical protein
MTAQILHLRDYKTFDERGEDLELTCLSAVEDALRLPVMFPIQYRRDTAPSEMNCDSGDCA